MEEFEAEAVIEVAPVDVVDAAVVDGDGVPAAVGLSGLATGLPSFCRLMSLMTRSNLATRFCALLGVLPGIRVTRDGVMGPAASSTSNSYPDGDAGAALTLELWLLSTLSLVFMGFDFFPV